MRRSFIEQTPEVEIRNGLVFVDCEQGQCVMSPATLAKFVARAERVLKSVQVAEIVPFRSAKAQAGH